MGDLRTQLYEKDSIITKLEQKVELLEQQQLYEAKIAELQEKINDLRTNERHNQDCMACTLF